MPLDDATTDQAIADIFDDAPNAKFMKAMRRASPEVREDFVIRFVKRLAAREVDEEILARAVAVLRRQMGH